MLGGIYLYNATDCLGMCIFFNKVIIFLNSFSTSAAIIILRASTAVVTGETLIKMLAYTRYVDVSHSATLEALFRSFKVEE